MPRGLRAGITTGKCADACDPSPGAEPGTPKPCSPSPSGRDIRCREHSTGVTEDWEDDIATFVQHEQHKLQTLIQQYEHELNHTISHIQPMGQACQLLEVFCSQHSPLTHQTQQLGRKAYRFGRSEGDLETVSGRAKLFGIVARLTQTVAPGHHGPVAMPPDH